MDEPGDEGERVINAEEIELVIRGRTAYLRKRPDRSVKAASGFRLLNLIQFSKLAIAARGRKSTNGIPPAAEIVSIGMAAVGRTPKGKPTIELSPENLASLQYQMMRRGIQNVSLPDNVVVKKGTYVAPVKSRSSPRVS